MKARITLEAEELLETLGEKRQLVLSKLEGKLFIKKEDVESVLRDIEREERLSKEPLEVSVEVKRTHFHPIAKEYEDNINIRHDLDVTGKSRTHGKVEDFINYFRNRFLSYRSLFRGFLPDYEEIKVEDIKKSDGQKVRLFCMVYDKGVSKNGNIVLTVEDLTGMGRAIISKNSDKFKEADNITRDDVIMIYGRIRNGLLIVDDFEFPEVHSTEFPVVEKDLAIAYISDTHFGSSYFMEDVFERFRRWLNGEFGNGKMRELAGKVKYLLLAGDVVDGVGIYPGQERELLVRDIYKQYEMFDEFVSTIPDYIKVVVIPGNHDAVRRAEPMPAISEELIKSDVIRLGNPAFLEIEGIKHLLYHGTSMDSMIANIPKLSYEDPKEVMAYYLKKRHLSPIYGENPIVPERVDYLLIRTQPHVIHTGHVHRYAKGVYRNIALINSATFQAQTDYQLKQGHVPTPGLVPLLELKSSRLWVMDFKEGKIAQ